MYQFVSFLFFIFYFHYLVVFCFFLSRVSVQLRSVVQNSVGVNILKKKETTKMNKQNKTKQKQTRNENKTCQNMPKHI